MHFLRFAHVKRQLDCRNESGRSTGKAHFHSQNTRTKHELQPKVFADARGEIDRRAEKTEVKEDFMVADNEARFALLQSHDTIDLGLFSPLQSGQLLQLGSCTTWHL